MSSTSIAYVNTARTLASVSQQHATGELTLTNGDHRWYLYFFHGRLLYATGSLHRVRRWRRSLKQHCSDFNAPDLPGGEPWEYHLLSQSVTQGQLNVSQAQNVIKMSLEEVLFSWVSNPALSSDWSSMQRFPLRDNAALSLLLSSTEVERILQQAQQLWKHWKNLELGALSPYQSPVLRPSLGSYGSGGNGPTLPSSLKPFLAGRHTLWDIASQARRPVTTVARFLLPWVQRGAIALEEIPDLAPPLQPTLAANQISSSPPRPLIACIDDSPTVGEYLASILEPAGYRVLKIQDPLAGIATLSECRPDLIFMDLVMPNASGYDLCNFLHKTPAFQSTPIIVLTSQNSLIDRTRARLAGAADFLCKPPDPQAMLSLVRSHLQSVMATPVSGLTDVEANG